jgi:hypothetical protein
VSQPGRHGTIEECALTFLPETILLSTPVSGTRFGRATDTRTLQPGLGCPVSKTAWSDTSHPQRCPKSAPDLAAPGTRSDAVSLYVATVSNRDLEDEDKEGAEDERKGKGEEVVKDYSPPVRSL